MGSPQETYNKVLALYNHPGTPKNERAAAEQQLRRMEAKHGFARKGCKKPPPKKPSPPSPLLWPLPDAKSGWVCMKGAHAGVLYHHVNSGLLVQVRPCSPGFWEFRLGAAQVEAVGPVSQEVAMRMVEALLQYTPPSPTAVPTATPTASASASAWDWLRDLGVSLRKTFAEFLLAWADRI